MSASSNETAVRARLNDWAKVTRAMDLDAITACYAPGAVSYDCHSAFQFHGLEPHRRHLEACFAHMAGPITFDIHELDVAAGESVAFCHFTAHCGCKGADGADHWCWLRATSCLRKIDGRWLIVHDHCSAPFDPMSEKVMLDARPDQLKQVA